MDRRDLAALSVVCKHLSPSKCDEVAELRKEIQRLRHELKHLEIRLVLNGKMLELWLKWGRARSDYQPLGI